MTIKHILEYTSKRWVSQVLCLGIKLQVTLTLIFILQN